MNWHDEEWKPQRRSRGSFGANLLDVRYGFLGAGAISPATLEVIVSLIVKQRKMCRLFCDSNMINDDKT